MKINTFAEMEAAGCPDDNAAPDDNAVVVSVLDLLANAAEDGGWHHMDEYAMDIALTGNRLPKWDATADALRALAARLRGAR
jgi:hypothetical protein